MKVTFICLGIASIFRIAFQFATAQTVDVGQSSTMPHGVVVWDSKVEFSGGVSNRWLTVERHNTKDWEYRRFDPCYVDIVSEFKPVVKKRPDGTWLIMFESDIATGLP
jgi:hypothetical protein